MDELCKFNVAGLLKTHGIEESDIEVLLIDLEQEMKKFNRRRKEKLERAWGKFRKNLEEKPSNLEFKEKK